MYIGTGCGCDGGCGCGGAHDQGLGLLSPRYSFDPWGGSGSGFPSPYMPGGGAYGFDVGGVLGDVWDKTRTVLGDIGDDLLADVTRWIQERIGAEVWRNLPESSREAAVREAWADVSRRVGVAPGGWGWVLALILLAVVASQPTRRGR